MKRFLLSRFDIENIGDFFYQLYAGSSHRGWAPGAANFRIPMV